ncbi:Divergent AAA-4 ATPase related protein (plasmid) [Deinococcus geothermalis DSM 11300]|uniref:Divergent AAA-4 ATPase related protein n=1 Tax=Deinococcus geothermalis (strain DSM 11300 / CIP 105573 / AG-3a) TaxID=319795 RepID=A8ZR59_DEIGD|nr:ATP-binding protein [Deinococcus geothermalis]ABW34968.1 Divergent AAA-4 ATPase related protein [Deinococcus geothermalis DSM 11300]
MAEVLPSNDARSVTTPDVPTTGGHHLPAHLDADLAEILRHRDEGPQVEFKRVLHTSGDDWGETVKDLCALANTGGTAFHGYAYLLVGVDDGGTVVGLPENLDHDTLERQLTDKLRPAVAPPLRFHVTPPRQHEGGAFLAIVIPPSTTGPHIIAGTGTGRATPGAWFVRNGKKADLAGPQDYARLVARIVDTYVAPLERAHQDLTTRYAALREDLDRLRVQVATGRGPDPADLSEVPTASLLQQHFSTPESRLAGRIRQEGLRFAGRQDEVWNPAWWAIIAADGPATSPEEARQIFRTLEELAQPLTLTVAQAVASGAEWAVGAAVDALRLAGGRLTVPMGRSSTDTGQVLRTYPLTLVLHAAAVVAAERLDFRAFRALTEVQVHLWPTSQQAHSVLRLLALQPTWAR